MKFGQQSLDVEFANHPSAGYFVNSLFGWPAPFATDMPGGGPAFPLSALGLRARATSGPWTALAGVFSGEFAGDFRLGGWCDNLGFADLRYNALWQQLANPAAAGAPFVHRGDFGLYAVAEQMVWRGVEKERTLSLFLRPILSPQRDRNLVAFSLNGGMALRDRLPGRKDDTFALGFGRVEIGGGAVGFSADSAFYHPGVFTPKCDYEAMLEATYQFQATPWAQIQPNLQYIRNPGGGLAVPLQPSRKVGDAVLAGVRINLTF